MAGTYTDIVEIKAPSSASPGEKVSVIVKVKNIDTVYSHLVRLIVVFYDIYGEMQSFLNVVVSINPLGVYSFSGSFTMPNCDTVIDAFTYYPYHQEWIFDDRRSKDISLVEVEVFAGRISRMELEYNEDRTSIPAYNIPQNDRGLVHIWGRNDMGSAQRMGIAWTVRDPDGVVVESYSTWEAWPYTGAGGTHEFIGGRFDLDKPGTYTIDVELLMNPADEVIVDDYYGSLCTVAAAVPEPEFSGFGITEYSKI